MIVMPFLDQKNQDIKHFSDEEIFIMSLSKPDFFSEIVDRYQQVFIKKAQDILNNKEDARDAAQEAFVRIYAAARQYRKMSGASFKSWAYKILINQCFTMYQKKKREWARNSQVEEEWLANLPDQSEINAHANKLSKDYLMSFISRLPAALARTVDLYFIQGIPQKAIAESEGVSHEVVRARIHKSKKRLIEMGLNNY